MLQAKGNTSLDMNLSASNNHDLEVGFALTTIRVSNEMHLNE